MIVPMKVLTGDPFDWNTASEPGSAVTIGVFDGVHRGHQLVLADLRFEAAERGLQTVVLTFDPHPLAVLTPGHEPPLVGSLDQRLDWLEGEGVDVVGILPFERIRNTEADEFVERLLVKCLSARVVVVGADFRYGQRRAGNVDTLEEAGGRFGFAVDAVPLLTEHDGALSSSNIRILVQQGDVEAAAEVLGRPFTVRGVVVRGDGRGAQIGVPTANLRVPDQVVLPRRGVYATTTRVGHDRLPSVTNVGVRPTFAGETEIVETHLLDADRDLYGLELDVEFLNRIRDEQAFAGVEELVARIEKDIAAARRIHR